MLHSNKSALFRTAILAVLVFPNFLFAQLSGEQYVHKSRGFISQGEFLKAIKLFEKNITELEKTQDSLFLSKAYFNRALSSNELGDFHSAEKYFIKSKDINPQDVFMEYNIYRVLAQLYGHLKQDSISLHYINPIVTDTIYTKYEDRITNLIYYNILISNKEFEKSSALLPKLDAQFENKDDLQVQYLKSVLIGSFLSGQKSFFKKYLNQGREYPEEVQKFLNLEFFELSSKIENAFGIKATELIKTRIEAKEFEISKAYTNQLRTKEVSYELNLQEQQNRVLQLTNQKIKRDVRVKNNIMVLVILGLILAATLIYIFVKQNKNIKVSNNNLLEKNQQIKLLHNEALHRSKNQISLAIGLVANSNDQERNKSRLQALAAVNNVLNSTSSECRNFSNLVDSILKGNIFSLNEIEIELDNQIEDLELNLNQITPISLILNELSVNSIKHAFDHVPNPSISIAQKIYPDHYKIIYTDNGKGMEKINEGNDSQGTELISGLVGQLDGSSEISSENGFKFVLKIPRNE